MEEKILVLADDMYMWKTTVRAVLGGKFTIITTENSDEVLERLSARDIDLVIISSRLPTGETCTEIIKKINLLYTELPILVLCELHHEDMRQEFIEAGAGEIIDATTAREIKKRVMNILNDKMERWKEGV